MLEIVLEIVPLIQDTQDILCYVLGQGEGNQACTLAGNFKSHPVMVPLIGDIISC